MEPDPLRHDDDGQSSETHTSAKSIVVWLAVSLLMAIAVSFATAAAPSRIRLIGLLPAAFGCLVGWLVARIALHFEASPSRRVTIFVAALLALGGWFGATWETFRLEEKNSPKSPTDQLAARMMKEFEQQAKRSGVETPISASPGPFQTFLSRRIRQLGDWSSPWPECFWVAEAIVAATVAGILSNRTARNFKRGDGFQPPQSSFSNQPN